MDVSSTGNQNFGGRIQNKNNLEPGSRVIQSLNTFLHFLPTTATEDSVAFARNPTSSLLCFLAGAFMFPVLCLFARFYAQCFVFFSVLSALVAAFQANLLVWHLHFRFFTAYVWTKAIPHVMPSLWLLKQKFRRFFFVSVWTRPQSAQKMDFRAKLQEF